MAVDDDTVDHLMGVARITANRYGFHDEETYANGYLVVAKCLTLHDTDREATLTTYTITALRNEFRRLQRKEMDNKEIICDPSELDEIADETDTTSSPIVVTTQIIQSLPRKYRKIVSSYWIKGQSVRVIATANKVSTSKIYRMLDEAMSLMRKYNDQS